MAGYEGETERHHVCWSTGEREDHYLYKGMLIGVCVCLSVCWSIGEREDHYLYKGMVIGVCVCVCLSVCVLVYSGAGGPLLVHVQWYIDCIVCVCVCLFVCVCVSVSVLKTNTCIKVH